MSRRRPLQPNAALAEMLAADREAAGDEPFGGYAGESITRGPAPTSTPPPPSPLVIEPPPWAEGGEPEPEESAA